MARRAARFEPPDLPPAGGVITSVARAPGAPDTLNLRLGRRSAGRIDEAAANRLNIHEGAAWTESLRTAIARSMLESSAREWALHAAARRAMSRSMLVTKLIQRGLDRPAAARIAEDLAARGVIDERAFAKDLTETTLARKSAGKRLLVNRLRVKGIANKMAAETVDQVAADSAYDERNAAIDLAKRKLRAMARLDPDAKRRRLYGLLARRGFDADDCRAAIESAMREPIDGGGGE